MDQEHELALHALGAPDRDGVAREGVWTVRIDYDPDWAVGRDLPALLKCSVGEAIADREQPGEVAVVLIVDEDADDVAVRRPR